METQDLIKVVSPYTVDQKKKFITEFEQKTGISLPTDEQIQKTIAEILESDKGKWKAIIPTNIIKLIEMPVTEFKDCSDLFDFRTKIVQLCYDQSISYSPSVISKLFGLCILKTVLGWSYLNYVVVSNSEIERSYKSFSEGEKIDNEDIYRYDFLVDYSKWIYKLLSEPLECICKANFGEQDIEWHTSEISLISINASIRAILETQQLSKLSEMFWYKFYCMIRGKRGVNTAVRKEYQMILNRILS